MTGNNNDFSREHAGETAPQAVGFITTDEAALAEDQSRLEDADAAEAARRQQEFLDSQAETNKASQSETFTPSDNAATEDAEEETAEADQTQKAEAPLAYDKKLLEGLCALYNIQEIPQNFVDNMGGMTAHYIMPDEKDAETPVMIAVVHDDTVMEVTQSRVISHPGVTVQTAYDMAMLTALNPKMMDDGVTLLPGSDEDRVLLYHAAKAFGLTVTNEHELTPEQRATPPENWKEFLAEKGMPYEETAEEPDAEPENELSLEDATQTTFFNVNAPVTPVDFGPQIDSTPAEVDYPLYNDPVLNGSYPEPSVSVYFDEPAETPEENATAEELPGLPRPEDVEEENIPSLTDEETETPETKAPELAESEPETAPEAEEASQEHSEAMASNNETVTEESAEAEEDHSAVRSAAEAKKAPVSEETMTALFNANVAKKTYMDARKQVINEGKASRSFLREAFNLTEKQAKTVQACLREENVIASNGANKHVVLVQP